MSNPEKLIECQVPPEGWRCTRGAGHEGPCAAVPVEAPPSELIERLRQEPIWDVVATEDGVWLSILTIGDDGKDKPLTYEKAKAQQAHYIKFSKENGERQAYFVRLNFRSVVAFVERAERAEERVTEVEKAMKDAEAQIERYQCPECGRNAAPALTAIQTTLANARHAAPRKQP